MKKIVVTVSLVITSALSYAQNAPFSIWGAGLDGSTYQQSTIYSDASNGLLIEGPLNSSGTKLPIALSWRGGGGNNFVINPNGNVGIGTASPISKLDVNGGFHTGGTSELGGGYLHVSTDQSFSSAANYTFRDGVGINNPNGSSFASGSSVMSIGAMSNGVSLITTGNVLIGQPSQSNVIYKLDVNGTARAKEVVVNSTGADFVFEPKYNLPKLSDVKTYIDQNHHLPEIPSATEMQKNGMNVGELNTKLLQKVEELTLYLIEKDKQVNNLQEQLIKINKKLDIK